MKLPSWLQKIIDKIKEWMNNNTTTTTTTPNGTTTTTTTPSSSDQQTEEEKTKGLDLVKAQWQGSYNGSNSKIKAKLLSVNTSNSGALFNWEAHTFPTNDGYCDGVVVVAWKEESIWKCGYFDYKGIAQGGWATGHQYDSGQLKNIYNGYNAQVKKDDEVAFFILSLDKTQRSNSIFAKWPLNLEVKAKSLSFKKLFGWMYKDNPEAPSVKPPHNGKPNNWPVFKG